MKNSFVIIFYELSNVFFRFSLRPIGAEIDGGVFEPPPPSRWWKIWSASGARVKFVAELMDRPVVVVVVAGDVNIYNQLVSRYHLQTAWIVSADYRSIIS